MACTVVFDGISYTMEDFSKALKNGLLYNLLDRKVIDLPAINQYDLKTSRKNFEANFVNSKEDIIKAMTDIFQLPMEEAVAVAEIYDRTAFMWAQRNRSTKEKFYQTLTVFKGDPKALEKRDDILNKLDPIIREGLKIGHRPDTTQVARERFNIPTLKLIGSGSDRDVFDLGEGKVLKVAKTARGLRQNMFEGLDIYVESRMLPTVYERGLNYVVVEHMRPLDPVKHKWVMDMSRRAETLNNKLSWAINKGEDTAPIADELEMHLIKHGYGLYAEADILWGDFSNPDNWGVAADGAIMLADAGTLAGRALIDDYKGKKDLDDADFKEIYERSEEAYEKFGDDDPATMYQDAQAAVSIAADGRAIIYALTEPNVSSPVHELAHVWERQLREHERQIVLDWAGQEEWDRETSEKFARGFERYLADGVAPVSALEEVFNAFKNWLIEVYKGFVASPIETELNDEMKNIYAAMLGESHKATVQQTVVNETEGASNIQDVKTMHLIPDTMQRRITEHKEPTAIKRTASEMLADQMADLNAPDKHMRPILSNTLDYYTHKAAIQSALDKGFYVEAIKNGSLTQEQVYDILKSVKWREDTGQSRDVFEKTYANVLLKVADEPQILSFEAFTQMSIDDPAFQKIANYYIDAGILQLELEQDGITPEQTKKILDSTTTVSPDTAATKSRLLTIVEDMLASKEKAAKKDAKEQAKEEVKIEEIKAEAVEQGIIEPTPIVDTPRDPTPEKKSLNLYGTMTEGKLKTLTDFIARWNNGERWPQAEGRASMALTEYKDLATTHPEIHKSLIEIVDSFKPVVEAPAPSAVPATPEGFAVGSLVSVEDVNYTIDEIDEDGFATLSNEDGGFKIAKVSKLQPPVEVVVAKDDRVGHLIAPEEKAELQAKRDALERISERMQKFLPSVKFEIDFFLGNWKGRIKNGVVQINLKHASLDTPIHEFMHPFVLALRLNNYELYSNLLQELREGHLSYYIDLIDSNPNYANLSQFEKEEEALVQYLGEDIATVFNERGQIDQDILDTRSDTFLKQVYQWFRDLLNKLWGLGDKPKKSTGEDAKSSAGRKAGGIHEMQRITFNKKTGVLKGYKAGQNEDRSWDIKDVTSEKSLKARGITPKAMEEIMSLVNQSEQEGDTIEIATEAITEIWKVKPTVKRDRGGEFVLAQVEDLPATATLRDMADFIIAQQQMGIDLSAQQTAIDKLDAYQHRTNKEANDILEKIKKRMPSFSDIASRRISNAQFLNTEAASVNRILRDYDGVEGVAQYIRQAMVGLKLANQLIRFIQEDLDGARASRIGAGGMTQGALTQDDINKLNRDLLEVKNLVAFYGDANNLLEYFSDEFDTKEYMAFKKIIADTQTRKNSIAGISGNLAVEWLFPYLEKAQENLPLERRLTKEQFALKFRMADRDISGISFWVGATINSRDPINAIVAVALKDKMNEGHIQEIDKLNDIRVTFDKWLKRTGVSNTIGAIEDYYKKNYLREAKVWETRYMPALPTSKVGDRVNYDGVDGTITEITNGQAKITGYANRWAFHEEYFNDLFEDDFRKYKETLGQPTTNDEWDRYNRAVTAWFNTNSPQISGNQRYRNPAFTGLRNDEYFQLLYRTYQEGNAKMGERKLKHGIVPQAYKTPSLLERGKEIGKNIKDFGKGGLTLGNIKKGAIGTANYVFDTDTFTEQQDLNLDGSYYRGVKSPFTHLINQENLDLRLNESVYGFFSAANTFSSLREIQANAENLKMLMEGNSRLGIEARKVARVDKTGKMVWDRFLGRPQSKERKDSNVNEQLVQFINDTFYGVDEFEATVNVGPINIDLNAAGRRLGFLTALGNMAGNVFAGVSNITIGNIMSAGEAIGGKYYGKKDWLKAQGTYAMATGDFMADSVRPVKSKITQLGVLYDAIQGEFRSKYGKNITGNIAARYAQGDTFFLINHVAEHQIQLTGMLALMNATKVKLKGGGEVSLYDAYQPNAKGFYHMRKDVIWTADQDNQFIKTLHGISKDLNGNYAAFDKGVIQRQWWGKLALQYRKYMYPAWRSRFSSSRVDYERGEVMEGFYRTFLKKLVQDIKDYKFNIFAIGASQWSKKGWTKEQAYAHRKTMFDLAIMVGTTLIGLALAGAEGDDDDEWSRNALLLSAIRLRSDISQYSWQLPQEALRQIKNPSASLNTVNSWLEFLGQLSSPTEEYSQNSGYHEKGDSKLGARFEKIVPLYRQWLRLQSPEEQVKFYTLTNKDIDNAAKESKEK